MVEFCSALNCINSKRKVSYKTFFRFPKDPKLLAKWITAVRRENWEPSHHSKLCCDHFDKKWLYTRYDGRCLLKKDAVPTLFKFPPDLKSKASMKNTQETQTDISAVKLPQNRTIETVLQCSFGRFLKEVNCHPSGREEEHVEDKMDDDVCVPEIKTECHEEFEEVEVKCDPDEVSQTDTLEDVHCAHSVFEVDPQSTNEPEIHHFVVCRSGSESYLVSKEYLNTSAVIPKPYRDASTLLSDVTESSLASDVTTTPDVWHEEGAISESSSSLAKRAIKTNQEHLAHDHYYHRLRDEKIVKKDKSIDHLQYIISELRDSLKSERRKVHRLQKKVTELDEVISMYQGRKVVVNDYLIVPNSPGSP